MMNSGFTSGDRYTQENRYCALLKLFLFMQMHIIYDLHGDYSRSSFVFHALLMASHQETLMAHKADKT